MAKLNNANYSAAVEWSLAKNSLIIPKSRVRGIGGKLAKKYATVIASHQAVIANNQSAIVAFITYQTANTLFQGNYSVWQLHLCKRITPF